jgi:hypothetical protein
LFEAAKHKEKKARKVGLKNTLIEIYADEEDNDNEESPGPFDNNYTADKELPPVGQSTGQLKEAVEADGILNFDAILNQDQSNNL